MNAAAPGGATRARGRASAPSRARVAEGLERALSGLDPTGPRLAWRGSLSRPSLAFAVARRLRAGGPLPPGFWNAALAVQLAHEASLVHDDIVDRAAVRRDGPSYVARHGVGRALLYGDHLLTTAFRAATATGSTAFARGFADTLAAMVAAEREHQLAADRPLSDAEYRAIVEGKTGRLLGCSLAAAAVLIADACAADSRGRARMAATASELDLLGRRTGIFYQRVDDMLDYCPSAATGKGPLTDLRNGRWTWVLGLLPPRERERADLPVRLFAPGPGGAPMRRALERVTADAEEVRADLRRAIGGLPALEAALDGWLRAAERGVHAGERHAGAAARGMASPPPGPRAHAAAGPARPTAVPG